MLKHVIITAIVGVNLWGVGYGAGDGAKSGLSLAHYVNLDNKARLEAIEKYLDPGGSPPTQLIDAVLRIPETAGGDHDARECYIEDLMRRLDTQKNAGEPYARYAVAWHELNGTVGFSQCDDLSPRTVSDSLLDDGEKHPLLILQDMAVDDSAPFQKEACCGLYVWLLVRQKLDAGGSWFKENRDRLEGVIRANKDFVRTFIEVEEKTGMPLARHDSFRKSFSSLIVAEA